jgi:hypothetical protein
MVTHSDGHGAALLPYVSVAVKATVDTPTGNAAVEPAGRPAACTTRTSGQEGTAAEAKLTGAVQEAVMLLGHTRFGCKASLSGREKEQRGASQL